MNTTPTEPPRMHDLVVWGATGYTGRLVALAAAKELSGRSWAIAGRSRERLEAIRVEIIATGGHPPEIVVADLQNATSMRAMTGTARVVLTTVGPYDHFGEPLIEACIATGTHVADITGEVPWVRRMRSKYEGAAREAGVRIVSMCGYDSIPSELGVQVLQATAIETHGRPAREIEMAVGPIRGGVSGGTVASASNMIARARDPEIQNSPRGAGALCVEPPSHSIRSGEQWGIRRSSTLEIWTAPFFMAGINVSVVHRTHELLGRPWGDDFRYRECAAGDSGLRGFLKAALLAAGTIAMVVALVVPPARWIARRWFLPAPGEGPDASRLRDGYVRHRTVSIDPPVTVEFEVDMDPGYAATAWMLLACGILLLDEDMDDMDDTEDMEDTVSDAFCTPGALFGRRLIPRLEAMGFRIRVKSM